MDGPSADAVFDQPYLYRVTVEATVDEDGETLSDRDFGETDISQRPLKVTLDGPKEIVVGPRTTNTYSIGNATDSIDVTVEFDGPDSAQPPNYSIEKKGDETELYVHYHDPGSYTLPINGQGSGGNGGGNSGGSSGGNGKGGNDRGGGKGNGRS